MTDWISENIWKVMAAIVTFAAVFILAAALFYAVNFPGELTTEHDRWGTFGDFMGGTLNPTLSFLALIALLLTIILQSNELKTTREELELSRIAQQKSEIALSEQADTLEKQLEQAKKATGAEFFFRAMQLLQEEDVRVARRKAFELSLDENTKKPFDDWTHDEKLEVEKACHTFDVVGKLVRFGLVEEKMILSSWHTTIKKTWRSTESLVTDRRLKDGGDFWSDFEWLYKQSRNYS